MLRIFGSKKRLCNGVSRRDLLQAGCLGLGGIGLADLPLADLLRLQSLSAAETGPARPQSFGKAKSVILLHLYGSPSQLEWADMKPHAPVEIRGELGSIASSLPGCDVCELLPNLAKVMDRTTVLRSLTHPYPIHGVAYALTGIPAIDVAAELSPHDPRHWPFFGSVVDFIDEQRARQAPSAAGSKNPIPRNIGMPFPFSTRRIGEVMRAGPYAAFLGQQYDPVWTDYVGKATKGIPKKLGKLSFDDNDPYIGLDTDSHFVIPSATSLRSEMTVDRLDRRRSLLAQLDDARRNADRAVEAALVGNDARGESVSFAPPAARSWDRHQQMAWSMMHSDALRSALDIRREPAALRESYGMTLFGQSCLAARRMVQAGARVVTVIWDEFGLAGHAWDTHYDHFTRMRKELCPGLDRAWYGLISDLDQRGMLEDTLVVCTSEHGRTPQINGAKGRDHWSRVYTSMVAGAGVKRGCVVGRSDKIGGDVAERPISPKDLLASMYHLLGIDPRTLIRDALNRPYPLVNGEVIHDMLS